MKRLAFVAALALCAGSVDRALAAFIPGDIFVKKYSADIINVTPGGNLTAVPAFSNSGHFSDLGRGAFSADLSTMYVSNVTANRVYAVSSSGVATIFATGLNGPMGLLRTTSGRLLVSEYSTGEVTDITAGGNFTGAAPFASGLNGPEDLAQTANGNLYVNEMDTSEISNITAGGVIGAAKVFASGIAVRSSMVANPLGGLMVGGGNNTVYSISPAGAATEFATNRTIYGLNYAADGRLLGVDPNSNTIYNISAGGNMATAPVFATVNNVDGSPLNAIFSVPTPEPAGLALLALAPLLKRRRRSQ